MKVVRQMPRQWIVIILILLFTISAVGEDAEEKIHPPRLRESKHRSPAERHTESI